MASDWFLFDDPPVLYREVDLAGIPGAPEAVIPYEIEPTLPFALEDAAIAFLPLGGRKFLAAACDRRALEARLPDAPRFAGILHRPLAEAFARAAALPRGEDAVIETGGYRFRFRKRHLVEAAWTGAPQAEGGEAPAIPPSVLRRVPLDFAPALGRGGRRGGRPLLRYALAAVVLAVAFALEGTGLSRRAAAAKAATAEAYRAVHPQGPVVAPRERLRSALAEAREKAEAYEAVVTKRDSALTLLAAITDAVRKGDAAVTLDDLRILPDRIEAAGSATDPEAAQRFGEVLAALPGVTAIEGPEIRRERGGVSFYIEAARK